MLVHKLEVLCNIDNHVSSQKNSTGQAVSWVQCYQFKCSNGTYTKQCKYKTSIKGRDISRCQDTHHLKLPIRGTLINMVSITISESGSSITMGNGQYLHFMLPVRNVSLYKKEGRQMQGNKVNFWHNLLNSYVFLLYNKTLQKIRYRRINWFYDKI